MIEINLLPGGAGRKRKARSGGGGPDFRAAIAGFTNSVKDPYMISAVASLVLAAGIVGGLWYLQGQREQTLAAAETQAVADSTQFANFMKQRRRAQATRDTVLRQINVIRAIDGDRYLWPHVLSEVSAAMPQYTWLTSLGAAGTPQGMSTPAIIGAEAPAPGTPGAPPTAPRAAAGAPAPSAAVAALDTAIHRDSVTIAIEGQTVDIEAITRFMRQLETSPFISDVQLGNSKLTMLGGKEVTTFTLQAHYVRVDSGSVIRRVPLTASVTPTAGN